MQPISSDSPNRVRIDIGEPKIENGFQKIPLRYDEKTHVVKVPVPSEQDAPKAEKTIRAVSREIDELHKRIRKERHGKENDEIRKV